MQVLIFAVCESIKARGIKLDIIGTYDAVGARSVPCRIPLLNVAMKIQFGLEDEGLSHRFQIRVVDADGKSLYLDSTLAVGPKIPEGKHAIWNHEYQIEGVILPTFGEYSVDLIIADETVCQWPLRALQHMEG